MASEARSLQLMDKSLYVHERENIELYHFDGNVTTKALDRKVYRIETAQRTKLYFNSIDGRFTSLVVIGDEMAIIAGICVDNLNNDVFPKNISICRLERFCKDPETINKCYKLVGANKLLFILSFEIVFCTIQFDHRMANDGVNTTLNRDRQQILINSGVPLVSYIVIKVGPSRNIISTDTPKYNRNKYIVNSKSANDRQFILFRPKNQTFTFGKSCAHLGSPAYRNSVFQYSRDANSPEDRYLPERMSFESVGSVFDTGLTLACLGLSHLVTDTDVVMVELHPSMRVLGLYTRQPTFVTNSNSNIICVIFSSKNYTSQDRITFNSEYCPVNKKLEMALPAAFVEGVAQTEEAEHEVFDIRTRLLNEALLFRITNVSVVTHNPERYSD